MKKLYVLFLLVALVPFTIGCGILGSNHDAAALKDMGGTVDFTASSVLAGNISSNMRGSAVTSYTLKEIESMVMDIGGMVLNYDPESPVTQSSDGIKIHFKAKISTIKLQQIVKENKPVKMQIKAAGKEVKTFEIVLPESIVTAGETAAPEITVKADGKMTIMVDSKSTSEVAKEVAVVETTGGITIVELSTPTITYGATATKLTEGITLTNTKPVFNIQIKNGSSNLDLTNKSCDFSINVQKTGSKTVVEYSKTFSSANPPEQPGEATIEPVNPTDGSIKISLKRAFTDGNYTVSIPMMAFTDLSTGKIYRLSGFKRSFNIKQDSSGAL